jgi:hypothetical protein
MHSPEEPARPHFTWSLSRKAGGVFHSRNRNAPRSRLGENRALPQNSMWAKYLISSNYPSCFFERLKDRVLGPLLTLRNSRKVTRRG